MISSAARCRLQHQLETAVRRSMIAGRSVAAAKPSWSHNVQFHATRSLVTPSWSVAMPIKTINVGGWEELWEHISMAAHHSPLS
jgi:hypothetical protein